MPIAPFSATQRRVLPTVFIPAFMSLLAVSIVNVTLPSIRDSLHADTSDLQWVVTGYALVLGVVLVAAGRAGDVWGRGKLFVAGLALFGTGALLSGLSPDMLVLNLARVLMGLGSGILSPQVSGIVQQYFQGELRGRAFGLFGGVVGVSVAVGPILGGALVAMFGPEWGWRSSFLVNVPIAAIAIVAARSFLPSSAWEPVEPDDPRSTTGGLPVVTAAETDAGRRTDGRRRGRADFDPMGMLLLTVATLAVMLPFMESALGAWVWIVLAVGLVLVLVWVRWELRYRARGGTPMVDMELFRTRSFANGSLLIALYFFGYTSIWLLVAQYMQIGLGHTALAAGLIGLPSAIAGAITAPIAGRYVVRVGRVMVLWGLGICVLGLTASAAVVLVHDSAGISEWWLLLTLGLLGVGQGFVVSPNQTLTLADVPLAYAGSAGGIIQTGQRIGTSIGIAVITGIAFSLVATNGWGPALAAGFAAIIIVLILALALATAGGAAQAKNPMVGGAPMYASKSIVENAVNSKDHTTLVAAVKAAGLADTLAGPGPFTVFAPTNAAFAKLPAGTVESLVQPQNKPTLTKILTYHVVPGTYTAKDLMGLVKRGGGQAELKTVEGDNLTVMQKGKRLFVADDKGNTARVTIGNVMQSNGVIHVIDTVLMP